ncbi:MAG: GNAT family N-acetyltransferase [Alphaproteobacteria bacterium]|nr:GNAT family N-acetyltransferase [Alphaproteobacteria bacterium]
MPALHVLSPDAQDLATAAREFCLTTIKATYGFDYTPAWHADLDSLTGPAAANHYAPANRGRFWVLQDEAGTVVGTAGVRCLAYKPNFIQLLQGHYPDFTTIASLWRTYLAPAYRGQGIGQQLNDAALAFARTQGYQRMFLECNHAYPKLQAYWQRLGYQHFTSGPDFCCFDRAL